MQVHRDKKSEHNCAKASLESPEAERAEALLQKSQITAVRQPSPEVQKQTARKPSGMKSRQKSLR